MIIIFVCDSTLYFLLYSTTEYFTNLMSYLMIISQSAKSFGLRSFIGSLHQSATSWSLAMTRSRTISS